MSIIEHLLYQTDKSSHQRFCIKKVPTQMFYCEYRKISNNTYFEEHLHTPASEVTVGSD